MPRRCLPFMVALVLLAACSSAPSASEPATGSPSGTGSGTRIDVRLTDLFRIEPGDFTVPAGVPVTFVVRNGGALEHEFFVGDEAAQEAHDKEMLSSGGMTHDEPNGIGLGPGESKELTITFAEAGPTLAGCHVPGHYAAGMKTTITVTE